jgi:hypothetical protein
MSQSETPIAYDDDVEVVTVPHEHEPAFMVRRLKVFGVILKVENPERDCARLWEAIVAAQNEPPRKVEVSDATKPIALL